MIYPTEKDLAILKSRSLFSKEVVDNFKQNKFEILKSIISEHLKTLQDDDDPYYKGFLYSILVRVFVLENNAFEVVHYVNEILKFSGMVLYEYCGMYSPFEKNTLEKVLVYYNELIKKKNIDAIWGKARILHFMNNWKGAHSLYEKALKIDPNNCMLLRMYGRLYEDECKYSKALELYEKIKTLGSDSLIDCFIANVYMKLMNPDYAIDILNNFLEKNPNNTVALFRLNNLYLNLDRKKDAERNRKKLVKLCPCNTKYLLYTTLIEDNSSLKLYQTIKKELDFGFNYSVVDRFIGDFCLNNKKYEKAVVYYQKELKTNPLYPPAYSNIFVSLMYLTKYLNRMDNKSKKYENLRQKIINKAKKYIIYDELVLLDCENADKLLENRIKIFESEKKRFFNNINIYIILYDLYSELNDTNALKAIIIEMKREFPESCYPLIKELSLFLDNEQFNKVEQCLNKIEALLNLRCPKQYKNKEIDKLKIINNFCISPEHFYEKESIIDGDKEIYKELISVYFDLCYKDSKYLDIAYDCLQKSESKEEEPGLIFIKALLYAVKGNKEKSQKIFNSIFVHDLRLNLLEMIKICGDIFDISYLHDLFINCKTYKDKLFNYKDFNNSELSELYFYQNVLLYLLHVNYVKSNTMIHSVSHYTSTKTLSFLLDDESPSPLRLCTLNSANDLKEGKILLDILSSNISDIKIIKKINEKSSSTVCALQTSFTLLKDALTMFRLYGKNENKEGMGVNLVFKKCFFNEKIKSPLNKCDDIFKKNNEVTNEKSRFEITNKKNDGFEKLSLYFVLYYDKKKDILVFNPFDMYKSSVIDLNKKAQWSVINQSKKSLLKSQKTREMYLNNISYVFHQLKNTFSKLSENEIEIAKNLLLNINYLVKDISFVDEKELRMISINELTDANLEHDSNSFSLYKNYMSLLGKFRYDRRNYLEEVILGPKVERKDSVAEYFINHIKKLGLDVAVSQSKAPLA